MKNWKHEAEILYFADGKTIINISKELGVSARSVASHLNGLPHYAAEVARRKERNRDRTAYYREHKRKARKSQILDFTACAAVLKKQHINDVKTLSRERFFNE